MDNKVFLLGLFLLSVANVKAQTQTQNDSLTMENMMHNLPEIMVKGSRPIVKAERGMLSYNMPLLMKQLPADNAYEALTRIPGVSDTDGGIKFSGNEVTLIINGQATTLTQEQLAERMGVATSFIGQIEAPNIVKAISLDTLFRIAKVLDVMPYKFLIMD